MAIRRTDHPARQTRPWKRPFLPPTVSPQPIPELEIEQPRFLPRRIVTIGLLLVLLVVAVVIGYQAFGGTPAPTPAPFAESRITDDWLQSRPLPTARANMALVGSGLNLYLIGGETAVGVTNTVAIFNTLDLVWQEGAPKPTAVTEITGAELFGEIYIPGGKLADGQPTNVVEVYSPANNSWRVATPLPTAVSAGLVLSDGSFLYLFGGWDGQSYLDNAYRFDPAANSWQILPRMATARAFVTGGVVKGNLYVVGGYDGEGPLNECAYFNPVAAGNSLDSQWHSGTAAPPCCCRVPGRARLACSTSCTSLAGVPLAGNPSPTANPTTQIHRSMVRGQHPAAQRRATLGQLRHCQR